MNQDQGRSLCLDHCQGADGLSRFYHETPVTIGEEGTLAEKVVCVRATGMVA